MNVDQAPDIGQDQLKSFEATWPEGFHSTLHKSVKTMAVTKKHTKVEEKKVYDAETPYARALEMKNTSDMYDTKWLLSFELSPFPASIFVENGHREANSKADLMNELKVVISSRNMEIDAVYIDGGAFLWSVYWPKKGTVQDFLNAVRSSVWQHLQCSDVYLIFDR